MCIWDSKVICHLQKTYFWVLRDRILDAWRHRFAMFIDTFLFQILTIYEYTNSNYWRIGKWRVFTLFSLLPFCFHTKNSSVVRLWYCVSILKIVSQLKTVLKDQVNLSKENFTFMINGLWYICNKQRTYIHSYTSVHTSTFIVCLQMMLRWKPYKQI